MGELHACRNVSPWTSSLCTPLCNDREEIVGHAYDNGPTGQNVLFTSPEQEEQELLSTIYQIRELARNFEIEYTAQNLRAIRPCFTSLDTITENFPKLDPRLLAMRNTLVSMVTRIQRSCFLPTDPAVAGDLQIILAAETLLDIIQGFSTNEPRSVVIQPPILPSYPIEIAPESTALQMFDRIINSTPITESAESTARDQARIDAGDNDTQELLKSIYDSVPHNPAQRTFEFYPAVYRIDPNIPLPGLDRLMGQLADEGYPYAVWNPSRVWICDFTASNNSPNNATLAPSWCDRYIDVDAHRHIFAFIATFREAYEHYAEILHRNHPDISTNLFTTFLMINTFEELFWTDGTDPWQDTGAADWFNVAQKDAYEREYAMFTDGLQFSFGIRIDEDVYDVPPSGTLWWLASMQVAIATQGLGPNAVITGDLLRTGNNQPALWNKYLPNRERTTAGAVEIAFDPRVSIGAVALILDAKLSELDQPIFSDPAVRLPDDVYPFIQDPQISRAYFRLSLARFFKAFPETAINFPDYFPYSLHSWNIEFLGSYIKLMEAALEQPDSLPDLETYFLPSYQHRSAMVDFMGDLNDPNVSDCLSIMLTPTP